MGVALRHGQGLVAQQFLQSPNVHAPHGQMAGVGVAQVVEPEICDPRLPARRCKGMLDVPDVPAVSLAPEEASSILILHSDPFSELSSELHDFADKLVRAADLHLEPGLNDGVVLNEKGFLK